SPCRSPSRPRCSRSRSRSSSPSRTSRRESTRRRPAPRTRRRRPSSTAAEAAPGHGVLIRDRKRLARPVLPSTGELGSRRRLALSARGSAVRMLQPLARRDGMGRTPGPRALRAAALFVPGILGVGAAALPERVAGPQAAGAAAADGTALTWPKRDEKPGLVVEEDTSVPDLPEVDTGFRPERDFYDFTNGDYKTDGWCLGMALLA